MNTIILIKNNFIKQIRSYSFLIVIGITMFLGYAFVPAASDGYEVFYIGGVRGIYNSAWLGGMVSVLSTLLLWLFGFYMLRSQVSEDERLKVGQVISSTPISNVKYIFSKASSNFLVLLVIEVIMIFAFMVMQLIRGEDTQIQLWGYLAPFLFITVPSLLVLVSLTILFDVIRWLKGAIGNIVFFSFWIFFSVISLANPNRLWDIFGLDVIMSNMVKGAAVKFDFIVESDQGGSFGYYPTKNPPMTFEWQGVEWDFDLLKWRMIWVFIAIVILFLSSIFFNRFKNNSHDKRTSTLDIYKPKKKLIAQKLDEKHGFKLTTVEKEKRIRLSRLVKAELRIMVKGFSIWWYLIVGGMILGSFLIPLEKVKSFLPIVMVWPIAIWSQMATREKYYFTRELLLSSGPPLYKFFSVWIAGIIVSIFASSGALVHFIIEGEYSLVYSWTIGMFFIPTLAIALGSLSGTRKLFEVIFMLWWYVGPINGIPYLDFLGISSGYEGLYLILTLVLLAVGIISNQIKTGQFHVGSKKRVYQRNIQKESINEKFK